MVVIFKMPRIGMNSPMACFWVAEATNKTEEETESLHGKLLDREMDIGPFVQKYKRLRATYHRRALTHLSAKAAYG